MGNVLNSSRVKLIDGVTISSSTSTSVWWDCRSWADFKVAIELGDAGDDVTLDVHISGRSAYELNRLVDAGSADTDYEDIEISSSVSGVGYTVFGEDDVADLAQPFKSVRVKIDGTATSCNVWLIGRG